MKKLVFMFAAVAAISFASCGNKTAGTAEVADSDTVAVLDSAVMDSAIVDSAAEVIDSAAAVVEEVVEEVAE